MSTDLSSSSTRRRRTRAQSRADNRQALLEAARQFIVEVGYANAQLDQIADRAGLTKGAIYSIFGGKLELFRAVVDEHARQVLPLLSWQFDQPEAVTAEALIDGLTRNYLAFLDTQDTDRLLAFELDLTGLALRDPATLAVIQGHERALVARLAEALTDRPRRASVALEAEAAAMAADLVLGALGGIGQRLVTSPWMGRDPDAIAAAVVSLLPVEAPVPADA